MIDGLWSPMRAHKRITGRKPRTYRQRARADYLAYSKKRRPAAKARRHARRQQLQYLRRDLGHIDNLLDRWDAGAPPARFSRWLGCQWPSELTHELCSIVVYRRV